MVAINPDSNKIDANSFRAPNLAKPKEAKGSEKSVFTPQAQSAPNTAKSEELPQNADIMDALSDAQANSDEGLDIIDSTADAEFIYEDEESYEEGQDTEDISINEPDEGIYGDHKEGSLDEIPNNDVYIIDSTADVDFKEE